MPLFIVEYLRNDTRETHGYYRPLIESDMWSVDYVITSNLQGYFSYFSHKISNQLRFLSLIESRGDLTKDGIVDDVE